MLEFYSNELVTLMVNVPAALYWLVSSLFFDVLPFYYFYSIEFSFNLTCSEDSILFKIEKLSSIYNIVLYPKPLLEKSDSTNYTQRTYVLMVHMDLYERHFLLTSLNLNKFSLNIYRVILFKNLFLCMK